MATKAGKVILARTVVYGSYGGSGYGNYVVVDHGGGYTTLYAHCSRVNASSGQMVRMGDPIAEVGDTGDATGFHLHFELHHNNIYLNPVYYVS